MILVFSILLDYNRIGGCEHQLNAKNHTNQGNIGHSLEEVVRGCQ